jgi:hypothetical protein
MTLDLVLVLKALVGVFAPEAFLFHRVHMCRGEKSGT